MHLGYIWVNISYEFLFSEIFNREIVFCYLGQMKCIFNKKPTVFHLDHLSTLNIPEFYSIIFDPTHLIADIVKCFTSSLGPVFLPSMTIMIMISLTMIDIFVKNDNSLRMIFAR